MRMMFDRVLAACTDLVHRIVGDERFDWQGEDPSKYVRTDDTCHSCNATLQVSEPGVFCRWCLACG